MIGYVTLAVAVLSLLLHFAKTKSASPVLAEVTQAVDVAKGALPAAPSA